MRSTLIVPALLGLAAAMPHDSPMAGGLAPIEAPVSLNKRATFNYSNYCQYVINWWVCQRLPASKYSGNSSSTTPDTATAFKANSTFVQTSNNAITPAGYMQSFQNLDGATSTSNYLGYFEFSSYNTTTCALKCNANKKCTAFNIFFERDPITTTDQYCCANPTSVTRIKCSLWGTSTTSTTANNQGQLRDSFQVAVAGSNGYNKQMVFSSSSSSSSSSTSAISGKSSIPTYSAPTISTAGSSPKSSVASSVKSSGSSSVSGASGAVGAGANAGPSSTKSFGASSSIGSAGGAGGANGASGAGANAGPSSTKSPGASSLAPSGGASSTPSVTTSPSLSSSAAPLSGLAVSSQSASVASADAAKPVTDPGSPVTASIATSATPCSTPVASPEVNFNLNRTTDGTQTIYVYGSIDQLGEWNVDDAIKMSFYDIPGPQKNWFVALNITAGTYFEYKYFQRNQDWSITWPDPANRMYTTPTGCQTDVVINDAWPS